MKERTMLEVSTNTDVVTVRATMRTKAEADKLIAMIEAMKTVMPEAARRQEGRE